jgi:dolichol-phosphate mannosyltransferase
MEDTISKKNSHILIMIPTYNEIGNIPSLVERLLAIRRSKSGNADILFIDDNSPDGTGKWLDECAKKHDCISVMHKSKKGGIGLAHQYGILFAYYRKYTHLITMDGDFTHSPEDIPKLLEKSGNYDVVIGGRHAQKDSLAGWTPWRKFLTHLDHQFTLRLLNLPYDATSAFRVYRIDIIALEAFLRTTSKSYPFVFESLCILHENGYSIYDVPVVLPPRAAGNSKLKFKDMVQWMIVVFTLGVKIRLHDKSLYLPDGNLT